MIAKDTQTPESSNSQIQEITKIEEDSEISNQDITKDFVSVPTPTYSSLTNNKNIKIQDELIDVGAYSSLRRLNREKRRSILSEGAYDYIKDHIQNCLSLNEINTQETGNTLSLNNNQDKCFWHQDKNCIEHFLENSNENISETFKSLYCKINDFGDSNIMFGTYAKSLMEIKGNNNQIRSFCNKSKIYIDGYNNVISNTDAYKSLINIKGSNVYLRGNFQRSQIYVKRSDNKDCKNKFAILCFTFQECNESSSKISHTFDCNREKKHFRLVAPKDNKLKIKEICKCEIPKKQTLFSNLFGGHSKK